MNGTPSVSVVVGVYNKERYVGECLRSVLAQTYGDFELIVVDDCSTDRSVAEIQAIRDARVRFIPLSVNSRRPAVPRNRGVELAQGKYIAFLDADDRWLPGKLEKQVAFMEAHPEVGFPMRRAGRSMGRARGCASGTKARFRLRAIIGGSCWTGCGSASARAWRPGN